MTVSMRRSFSLGVASVAAVLLSGCIPAAAAGVLVGGGIVAAVLVSNCHEPVSVQVWDHTSAYPICDAEVTAEKIDPAAPNERHGVSTFSPCYQTYLGTGLWKITASKPGFPVATGTVEISDTRSCSQPAYHSLDLTLGTDAALSPQSAPPRPPATSPSPPVSAPPATSPSPPASAPPATSPAAPAPASTVPSAAFPPSASPGTDVPAPPTR